MVVIFGQRTCLQHVVGVYVVDGLGDMARVRARRCRKLARVPRAKELIQLLNRSLERLRLSPEVLDGLHSRLAQAVGCLLQVVRSEEILDLDYGGRRQKLVLDDRPRDVDEVGALGISVAISNGEVFGHIYLLVRNTTGVCATRKQNIQPLKHYGLRATRTAHSVREKRGSV